MKQEKARNIANLIFGITLILSSLGMATSYLNYGILFHNIDLSYNMALLSNDYGINYRTMEDRYSLNETMLYSDGYIEASDGFVFILKLNTGSSILFGLSLMYFLTKK